MAGSSTSQPKIIRKNTERVPRSAVEQIVSDYFPNQTPTLMELQSKIEEISLNGESHRATDDTIEISESHYRGAKLSGSFQYVGNHQSSQSPAHATAELWHFNHWSGSINGALNIQNASSAHGSQVFFKGLISGSYPIHQISSSNTNGFGGRFVLDTTVSASGGTDWEVSGEFPTRYYTSSAVSAGDITKMDGSYFTGSVIVGQTGSLYKSNFITGNPMLSPSTPAHATSSTPQSIQIRSALYGHTLLSASIELAWDIGQISGSDAKLGLHRIVTLGGIFDTSASLFNDDTALITKILSGNLFAMDTKASGSLASSPDGVSIDRSTKPGSSGNYFAKRNADTGFRKTTTGAKGKYAVSASKAESIKGTATGRKLTADDVTNYIK